MERLETQTLLRSGVADIGKTLHEISVSADKILDNVSKYMDLLQGDELFLGESSNALIEKYEKFKNEFPKFIKEIDNYSEFMTNTLISYEVTDTQMQEEANMVMTAEISKLEDAGNIGDNK